MSATPKASWPWVKTLLHCVDVDVISQVALGITPVTAWRITSWIGQDDTEYRKV
jgi:hypothetical protein